MTVDEQHEYQESTGGRTLGKGERDRIRSEVIAGGRHIRHLDRGEDYERDCPLCEDFLVHCQKDGCWDGKESPAHHLAQHGQKEGGERAASETKG